MRHRKTWLTVALVVLVSGAQAPADVFNMGGTRNADGSWTGLASLEMVTVGNPGNAADDTGYGAVDYTYQIGKFEVTAGQYCEFLNAVAATDTYELYNTDMGGDFTYGCGIKRAGSPGGYSYSVSPAWANHPVNYVSWGNAARFCNWMQNGQPTGPQALATTEDGSYYLNGATGAAALIEMARKAKATWVIPTEDEWYKAAYHKNDGVAGNYWDYPTGTDSTPSNGVSDTGNSANFADAEGHLTVGYPYYTTPVGAFGSSESPYQTFDQGGNLREWNETSINDSGRGLRGGSWGLHNQEMLASARGSFGPTALYSTIGFRVASVPDTQAPVPGDANLDGRVDDLDASILAANWQRTGDATWAQADFNGDGKVNDVDASILAANWQYGVGSAVPEPSIVALLGGLAVMGLLARWWRRRVV